MGITSSELSVGGPLQSDAESIPRNEIFEVLSNERRQCIMHYLKRHQDRRVELRELVDHVAAWENDTTLEGLDSTERKRVYTALRQSHLPKLEKAGVIRYEHQRGEVEVTEQARQVQLYLEHVPAHDIPWSEYYLGLSAVGIALLVVSWIGVFPFGGISGFALATILVILFAVSAVVHTYQSRQNRLGSDRFEVPEP